MTLINYEWHSSILMVNNNYNQPVKYNIMLNYEYGQFLHLTTCSIIDIKNCVNLAYYSDLKKNMLIVEMYS